MKVTGQNPQRAGEVAGHKAREAEARRAAGQGKPAGTPATQDTRASLTLSKVRDTIRNEPDVRADKVAALKRQVQGGKYRVDPDRLAANLLTESLQEDLEKP
ncbi:MAG TPA: flagellar biosynthesis anti-sigma factor FlgM [bacterium]|nr:flagellar biosynthesis anti-sigma factor FlgM [bacterium]